MGSSGARWLGKQSVVKTPSACAVVTPPVMTVRPKMMTSQDLRTVLSPLGSRPGQAGGPPYPPSLSAFRSKVLSAIDVMALLRGRGWVPCACVSDDARRRTMRRGGRHREDATRCLPTSSHVGRPHHALNS